MPREVVERALVDSVVVGEVAVNAVELRLENVIDDEAKNEDIIFCEVRTDDAVFGVVRTDDTVVDWLGGVTGVEVDEAGDDEAVVEGTLNLLLDASLTLELVDKSLVDGAPSQG